MKAHYATRLAIVSLADIGLVILGIVTIIGHITNTDSLVKWGTDTGMAPSTAVCMIIIGAQGLIIAHLIDKVRLP